MEQLLVRVYDVDFREFYAKYRDGQGEAFMSLVPPGAWKASTPPVSARMNAQAGVYAFNYEGLDGKTLCILEVRQPLFEADAPSTIVRLYWEEEAANFASGFLDWLHGNFRTDTGQKPLTPKERERLETLEAWPASGMSKQEYADSLSFDVHTLTTWARELHAKGYDTDWYRTGRKNVP